MKKQKLLTEIKTKLKTLMEVIFNQDFTTTMGKKST